MTSPQPTPDQQPTGLTGTEQAVVDALTTALLEGTLVAGTAIPLYLLLRLSGLGISRTAARAAIRLGLTKPVGRKAGPKVAGTAIGQVRADEPQLRAMYIVNAAKRIDTNLKLPTNPPAGTSSGEPPTTVELPTALREERRNFDLHVDAGRNRQDAAHRVDQLAKSSPWMVWTTRNDARVEAECRGLRGTMFTIDDPPRLNGRVVWPGSVHGHCRCTAQPFGSSALRALPTVTATR